MKSKTATLFWTELINTLLVIGGTFLFHFIYEWSGNNAFVGLFSATNESVFEHIKILFFPYLMAAILEYLFLSVDIRRYVIAKICGLLILPLLVIVVFYTYTGIIGYHIPIVDMLSAVVYAIIGGFISYSILKSEHQFSVWFYPALILFIIILIAILIFSVYPPHIPLFYDKVNQIYGMKL